jgi:phenylacetate-CoA ligase
MEYGVAEVTDAAGQPLPNGQVGKLVGTSLHNLAMPLIRYVTNDMSALKTAGCSCGRALELMDDVTTKAEDVLTLRDGRLISPSVLTHPFKPLDSIEGSQIVQTALDHIVVKIVRGPGYTPAHEQHLVTELKARLGEDVRVDLEMVDRLEPSANGKFKWVVSHVPLGV